MTQAVPLVDLAAQYVRYKSELDEAVARCVRMGAFVGGEEHAAFAREFADFCGGGHVALCGNGTDALYLAIVEVLGQGDGSGEIVTVSHTFIGTTEAIILAGYRPVFADIDPETCLMDLSSVGEAITERTLALLPVHLYGQMVNMDQVADIARRHGLSVIEDAAQAHGAQWRGMGPGHLSDAACFSFFPGKNLGAWGDGGAVFTKDQALCERIRMHGNHGRRKKYVHERQGMNSRLDTLQAAVLRVKLRHLEAWNERRREVGETYGGLLKGLPCVKLPVASPGAKHVYHLYVVQLEDRDRVIQSLHAEGILAGIHYPVPLHEQPVYRHLGYTPEALPVTHRIAGNVLSVPIYPEITDDQIGRVAKTLSAIVA